MNINLLHHMAASERLRIKLNWPESVRAQMMVGALAPDAHTEASGYDRTWLHPEPGTDVVAYVIEKLTPDDAMREFAGQAFALSVIAHLIADEFTRPLPAGMPWDSVSVYSPAAATDDPETILDLPAMRHALQRATPQYGVMPLTAEQIVAKRRDALARAPLSDAQTPFVATTEMARVLEEVVTRTLRLIQDVAIDSWRRIPDAREE